MDRKRADGWCQTGILGLLLAALIYGPLAFGAVRLIDTVFLQTLTAGALLLWTLRLWLQGEPRLFWPPMCWTAVLFAGYAVARYAQADIEYVAREQLIRVLIYAALFLVIVNNLSESESTQVIVVTLVLLGTVLSFYAGYQFLTGTDRVWGLQRPAEYGFRGSGSYMCPNHLAGFLEMVLPLALAYVLMSRAGHALKILLAYGALVTLGGIGFTLSRGGWVAAGLALVVFFVVLIRLRHYRLPALGALLALVVAGGAFVANTQSSQRRFESLFASGKLEDVRFRYWGPAMRMWQENLWWGVGPGHFGHRFRAYRPEELQIRPMNVHNDYLNTLTDWGLAGGLIVLAALILLGVGVAQTWRRVRRPASDLSSRHSNRSAFVLGASVSLLALALHSWVDYNLHIPANAVLAVALMALLTGHWRFATDRFWWRLNLAGRITVTAVFLAVILYLGQQAVIRSREHAALARVAEAKPYTDTQMALLPAAHAVEPKNFETTFHIGEGLRLRSFHQIGDYETLARQALDWFKRGIELNPHEANNYLHAGMCLDWLEEFEPAGRYFEQGRARDPNGSDTLSLLGWHYAQLGDFGRAREILERAVRLRWDSGSFAHDWLDLVNQRLKEQGKR
jgi:O-antigen ligase